MEINSFRKKNKYNEGEQQKTRKWGLAAIAMLQDEVAEYKNLSEEEQILVPEPKKITWKNISELTKLIDPEGKGRSVRSLSTDEIVEKKFWLAKTGKPYPPKKEPKKVKSEFDGFSKDRLRKLLVQITQRVNSLIQKNQNLVFMNKQLIEKNKILNERVAQYLVELTELKLSVIDEVKPDESANFRLC